MPPSDPVEQGDEGNWDTTEEPSGGSRSPAPTVEELLAQLSRQPPVAEGSTEPAAAATEEAAATEAQEEAPAECNTLKFSNFRMLIGKIIKQRFLLILKFCPRFIFFTGNLE
jgi:hypothetical protein